jgi:branched-subunit amino acid ABC-type transport system permease component
VSLTEVEQLTVAGVINGSAYALLGVSFALVLGVTGRFHYAFALVYTVAAYATSVLIASAGFPWPAAMVAGLIAAVVLGMAIEWIVYRPLARASGALSLLAIFIAALGITIAGTNGITLIWSSQSRSIDAFSVKPLHIGSVTFTTLELALVVCAWALVLAVAWMLAATDLGRAIKAVRGNLELARTMGLAPGRIYLVVFALSSALCGLAAIFGGMRFAVQPDMGTRPVVFAFVVAFLGGTRSSPVVVGLAGLFLGLVESLSGLWVSPQWSSLVVFSVLFVYLTLRPVELRGLLSRVALRPSER